MRSLAITAALLTVLVLAPLAYSTTRAAAPACKAGALAASFRVIPGSAGAGNIAYRLRVVNRAGHVCTFSGFSKALLRDRQLKALPTHAHWPETFAKVSLTLRSGRAVSASARFSPDVPGVGEGHPGQCERTAYYLDLTPGRGLVRALVKPATPVCEHGSLVFSYWK